MNTKVIALLISAISIPAQAFGIFDNYTLSKEVVRLSFIKVKPNKIDEYLEGISQTRVADCNIQKKLGSVIQCAFYLDTNIANRSWNLVIQEIVPSAASQDPDEKRYRAYQADLKQLMDESKRTKLVANYELLRDQVDEADFRIVQFK